MEAKWVVRANDFRKSPLEGPVKECTQQERVIQSLKKLGLFWGAGVLCILIPVLHFFLVPTFLGLGLFLSYRALKNKRYIQEGSYHCPACQKKNFIKNNWFVDEGRTKCEHCGEQLVILNEAAAN